MFTMITRRITRFTFYIVTVFFLVFVKKSMCWKFETVDLPEDVFISKFAIWRNRAFLAVPRWQRNVTSENTATLFEVVWPGTDFSAVKTSKIVSSVLHNKPVIDECLRSVVDVNVDIQGRLWLLEVPDNSDCAARVVVYNLKRNNHLVASTDLKNVPTKNLRTLIIDHRESRGYIGDPGDESIIVFTPEKGKWWKIRMIQGMRVASIFSTDIAICRQSSKLYVTGPHALDVFSINLEDVRNDDGFSVLHGKSKNVTAIWHGTKMGASNGLFCDVKDGLHYFMSTERASVRWDTKLPLKAESHSILLQNENCPCVTDYTMDGQKNLWGLINSECPIADNINHYKEPLKSRTIKIGKYSIS